ncbi:MAG: glycosyltransferase family 2 protein [Bryobacterales bacterium]|nr:glycosyltransferase family 2 protein [Bryobacterales bacterium]
MPTYGRADVVDRCLRALTRQTLAPESFEVIVADDGSPDHTCAITEKWAKQARDAGGADIVYSCAPNAGANAARNRGLSVSRAPIVLLINDDSIPAPTMLERHLMTHRMYEAEEYAVLGRVTVDPELPPSRLAALHLDRAFNAIGGRRELDWRWFFTCNVSVKKSLVIRAGSFEERMRYHEDLELAERLSHLGLRVIYNPDALAYHYHFLSEAEFLGIARREARALAVWAHKAPRLRPVLAEFGFEPALAIPAKLKNRARALLFNPATNGMWSMAARNCPTAIGPLALKIYLQIYQSEKRRWLLSLLNEERDK